MKILAFIFCASIVSTFHTVGFSQETPPLMVQNFEWGALHRISPPQPVDPTIERSGRLDERLPGDQKTSTQLETTRKETYALVKNVAAKTTKTIEWEFIFFSDDDAQKELKRYKFRNKIKIAPNDTKFMSKDVNDRAPSKRQKVNILRIEYADGSIWQAAEPKLK